MVLSNPIKSNFTLLRPALIFLLVGLTAGLFELAGVAGPAVGLAKIFFFLFIALFVLLLLAGARLRASPRSAGLVSPPAQRIQAAAGSGVRRLRP